MDDEAAYNNIATIVDAWENLARMIEQDDGSEFLLYFQYHCINAFNVYRLSHSNNMLYFMNHIFIHKQFAILLKSTLK